MTYRMESAKPPPPRKWAYSIDYNAEISADEQRIAYLDGAACKACSSLAERLHAEGNPYASQLTIEAVLYYAPELHAVLGLTADEARAFLVVMDVDPAVIPSLFGPVVDFRADYKLGNVVADRRGPDMVSDLGRWYVPREADRVAGLKRAKASLSRHRRNREKYGKK